VRFSVYTPEKRTDGRRGGAPTIRRPLKPIARTHLGGTILVFMADPSALSPELIERVRLLSARVMFADADGRDVVRLACDLLVAGIDTPSIVELAALPYSATMNDVDPLFRAMLVELGRPQLPRDEAGWLLVR
jgi:hypothetical protein